MCLKKINPDDFYTIRQTKHPLLSTVASSSLTQKYEQPATAYSFLKLGFKFKKSEGKQVFTL
jgi:hypothetical protein